LILRTTLGQKIETPQTPQTRMSSVDKSSTGSEKSPKIIERFNKIIHKEEIIPEDNHFYNNKYFICGCFLLISNYSDYKIINNFLLKQFDKANIDFEFNLDNKFYFLIFKYKKVNIFIKQTGLTKIIL
jgi:hypothetical protein